MTTVAGLQSELDRIDATLRSLGPVEPDTPDSVLLTREGLLRVRQEVLEQLQDLRRPRMDGGDLTVHHRAGAVEVRERLWNEDAKFEFYDGDSKAYQAALLEQYKMYVEMADRISQRRGLTNTFFLTLNTAIFTAVGVFWQDRPDTQVWWLVFPLLVVLGQCFAWFYLVRSYRLLNSAKYEIIGALEEHLPASPYWRAEWLALGEGKDPSLYWPLTHIEKWIPILFAFLYLAGFVALVVA